TLPFGLFRVHPICFDHEDVQGGFGALQVGCGVRRYRRGLRDLQGNLEPEGASRSGRADDSDRPSHGFDQVLGNGEPQAGSSEPAVDASIFLAELLEQSVLRRIRASDPPISYFEAEARLAVRLVSAPPQAHRASAART